MYTFLYSHLVYFFIVIYTQHSLKPFYIKYHKIICSSHRQLTSQYIYISRDLMRGPVMWHSNFAFSIFFYIFSLIIFYCYPKVYINLYFIVVSLIFHRLSQLMTHISLFFMSFSIPTILVLKTEEKKLKVNSNN